QRSDVDPARSDVLYRPVELEAPAECTLEVELLDHDLVDNERQRLVWQGPDLDDRASSLHRGDAGVERMDAARGLERDVELRRGDRIGLLVGANGARGADRARRLERPVEHVASRHRGRAL